MNDGTELAALLAQVSVYTKRERLLLWCIAVPIALVGAASWYFVLWTILTSFR